MAITMRCPGCNTRFEFADDLAGKRIKCKSCGEIFRIQAAPPKSARSRAPVEDDDRPPKSGRSRRPAEDEDDDRPPASGRRRRPVADDEDDDRPRRRRDEDDEDDDRPRKKKSPVLLIALLVGGLVVLGGIGGVVALVLKKGGKGGPGGPAGDVVQAPAKSVALEVAEKDAGLLVLPDSGHTFGLLRKTDTLRRLWTFDAYDIAAGRRTGRVELTDLNEPRYASLSPDGKFLLIQEAHFGSNSLTVWSIAESRALAPKWDPYPNKTGTTLYRADFLGNDRLVTLSTARVFDVWQLPNFDRLAGDRLAASGDPLGQGDHQDSLAKYQRQVAFTADHKLMAVWNGNGYTFLNPMEGETGRTPAVRGQDFWRGQPFNDRIKAGPVAFSPDGNTLAGIISQDFGNKNHVLCLWNVRDPQPPVAYPIAHNQFNDSPAIYWWGNQFVVTHGARVEGMLVDIRTGLARRQLMGPVNNHYGFGRDGRLWYAVSKERTEPAMMHVVDGLNPDLLADADDYDQIRELGEEFFLRRLWLEPEGVLRSPTRFDPPHGQRVIRRP